MNPYPIAITMIPGLGCHGTRQLLELFPNPEEVFSLSHAQLVEIFGTRNTIVKAIEEKTMFPRVEQEITFMKQHGINTLFCTDKAYPQRLNRPNCEDTPVLLYYLGNAAESGLESRWPTACDLNNPRALSIVGSRRATDYGHTQTHHLIEEIRGENVLIVSGLAYGIDTAAHTAALQCQLPTVAVLGHGLDTLYPAQNKRLSKQILEGGGLLLTEYPSQTPVNPRYFPARNRIIAAMSDATVVMEAAEKGGALITANIANGYSREVFALPGRLGDAYSAGCNNLIACNKAYLLRSAGDLFFQLDWTAKKKKGGKSAKQTQILTLLNEEQSVIANLLKTHGELPLDEIVSLSAFTMSKTASLMLEMELSGVIRCLPGKIYKLV